MLQTPCHQIYLCSAMTRHLWYKTNYIPYMLTHKYYCTLVEHQHIEIVTVTVTLAFTSSHCCAFVQPKHSSVCHHVWQDFCWITGNMSRPYFLVINLFGCDESLKRFFFCVCVRRWVNIKAAHEIMSFSFTATCLCTF